jgi:hypothetical protein
MTTLAVALLVLESVETLAVIAAGVLFFLARRRQTALAQSLEVLLAGHDAVLKAFDASLSRQEKIADSLRIVLERLNGGRRAS